MLAQPAREGLVRELSILIVDAALGKQLLSVGSHFPKEIIMKTGMGKLVVFALAALTIGVFAGHAQIVNQLEFKMSQPFAVGNTTLAAGSYIIRPISGTDQSVVEISSASGKPEYHGGRTIGSARRGPGWQPPRFQ